MKRVSTTSVRTWVTVSMFVILVTSLLGWFIQLDRPPGTPIKIATGKAGGLYHRLGKSIEIELANRTNRSVSLHQTEGSNDNFREVEQGHADLGIVQGGPVPIEKLTVVTPLFPELVFIIARKGSGIETIADLPGKAVSLGPEGSGTRSISMYLLEHFQIDSSQLLQNTAYYKTLLDEPSPDTPSLDAAIVTSGIGSPDLREVLATNRFTILPIYSAKAIEMIHPFLRRVEIH